MMDFNPLAARLFASALKEDDKELALSLATDVFGAQPPFTDSDFPTEYNDAELASLIEGRLDLIETGRADMNWNVYIPQVFALIDSWSKTQNKENHGKVDSEFSDS